MVIRQPPGKAVTETRRTDARAESGLSFHHPRPKAGLNHTKASGRDMDSPQGQSLAGAGSWESPAYTSQPRVHPRLSAAGLPGNRGIWRPRRQEAGRAGSHGKCWLLSAHPNPIYLLGFPYWAKCPPAYLCAPLPTAQV